MPFKFVILTISSALTITYSKRTAASRQSVYFDTASHPSTQANLSKSTTIYPQANRRQAKSTSIDKPPADRTAASLFTDLFQAGYLHQRAAPYLPSPPAHQQVPIPSTQAQPDHPTKDRCRLQDRSQPHHLRLHPPHHQVIIQLPEGQNCLQVLNL